MKYTRPAARWIFVILLTLLAAYTTAQTLRLTLWDDGCFNPQTGIEIKVEDGLTYARRGQDQHSPDP